MTVETMNNKREFNARVRELTKDGYTKCNEHNNKHRFRKHVYGKPELVVVLVQGWKNG